MINLISLLYVVLSVMILLIFFAFLGVMTNRENREILEVVFDALREASKENLTLVFVILFFIFTAMKAFLVDILVLIEVLRIAGVLG